MPIYEYECGSCGKTFEAMQKFSDAPLDVCRECGAEGVRKRISAPAFRLKGGGWYETDFKKDKQRNVAKAEGESKSGGSDSAGGAEAGKAAAGKSEGGKSDGGKSDGGRAEGGKTSSGDSGKSGGEGKGSGKASSATG